MANVPMDNNVINNSNLDVNLDEYVAYPELPDVPISPISPIPPPPPSYDDPNGGAPEESHELPTKLLLRPEPQTDEQSIEEYLKYYDHVVSTNLWNDQQAAWYLPKFITDQRYLDLFKELSFQQRQSYVLIKQILLKAHEAYDSNNNNCSLISNHEKSSSSQSESLCQKYWTKIGDLKSHLSNDLWTFRQELHGLVGETFQHVNKEYVNPVAKTVLPKRIGGTVTRVLERVGSAITPTNATPTNSDGSPSAPPITPERGRHHKHHRRHHRHHRHHRHGHRNQDPSQNGQDEPEEQLEPESMDLCPPPYTEYDATASDNGASAYEDQKKIPILD